MLSHPPGLVVEHARPWAYFPADWEQQGSWRDFTRHLEYIGMPRSRARGFTGSWLPVLRDTIDAGCVGVFLRMDGGLPDPPEMAVRLSRHEHDPALPAAQAVDEVLRAHLRSDDPRLAPPLIEPVPGSGVGAVRMRRQVGRRRWARVQEQVRWFVPVAGAVWVLSTSLTDYQGVVAANLRTIDELANGMRARMPVVEGPVVVLRPGVPGTDADPHRSAQNMAHCSLTIDREKREVTWVEDAFRRRRVHLPLGSGPGEVAGLLRATFPPIKAGSPQFHDSWRLMLIDADGRVLVRSALEPLRSLDTMWPVELLETSGLPVYDRRFTSTRQMEQAHPGAAPMWIFTGGLWMLTFWALLGAVLLLVVGGLLVGDPIWSDW
ncbi:hypothetical protein [Blastococcus atacamensis]|uniref:hypothetical protein n=1 Tax=Blastococcus atacamensis TaxID=2070508 RepID=UPI000CECA75C|nr:hypothetical protein [Blastococcus atacamensis]